MLLKPTLSLSNRIGRLAKIINAIRAKESVVNLATPHSDEAKAKIDNNCMRILRYSNKTLSDYLLLIHFLIKNYYMYLVAQQD